MEMLKDSKAQGGNGNLLGPKPRKNSGSHIDASHSRQPLVKGERLVRNEVNAVMPHGIPWMHPH